MKIDVKYARWKQSLGKMINDADIYIATVAADLPVYTMGALWFFFLLLRSIHEIVDG